MSTGHEHAYPPRTWTATDIADALDRAEANAPLPTYDDEEIWQSLVADDTTGPIVGDIVDAAADGIDDPVPFLPASEYLEYVRSGDRSSYQTLESDRWERLARYAIAECVEREGRFLDAVLDHAWALCEQSTWLLPAHLSEEDGLPRPKAAEERRVALRSAMAAKTLAEVDYVLGSELHPALRERIRHEIDEQVLTPYLARDDFSWLGGRMNWNAVCNAGSAIAALYVADTDRAASVVEKAVDSLEGYLQGFDSEGCTPEGIGYWSYGFGNYVHFASVLEARSDGTLDLCSPPIVEKIARYPLRIELSPGTYVPFSDVTENKPLDGYAMCWLADRFDLPALADRGRRAFEADPELFSFSETLRNLLWCREAPSDSAYTPPARDFLAGNDWWFARADPGDPDGLVVAAKGGNNDEPHNHNDCGSFVVHRGGDTLLTDLGRHAYDADYFGPKRYTFLATRSIGHSVPYVNGCEQADGEAYAATLLDREEGEDTDSITLDVSECYPAEAGLESLVREIALDRTTETVRVDDRATFADDAGNEFESILVSYDQMSISGERVEVTGDESSATVEMTGAADLEVERIEDGIDVSYTTNPDPDLRDVWRARIRAENESVGLEITTDS